MKIVAGEPIYPQTVISPENIRDCLPEIAVLHGVEARTTLHTFRNDPIVRRAAAYTIQTISEAVRRIPNAWLADFPSEPWGQIKGIGKPHPSRVLSRRRCHSVGHHYKRHPRPENRDGGYAGSAC